MAGRFALVVAFLVFCLAFVFAGGLMGYAGEASVFAAITAAVVGIPIALIGWALTPRRRY